MPMRIGEEKPAIGGLSCYERDARRLIAWAQVLGLRHPNHQLPQMAEKRMAEASLWSIPVGRRKCATANPPAQTQPIEAAHATAETNRALLSLAARFRSARSASASSGLSGASSPSFMASQSSINASRRRGHLCQAEAEGSRLGATCLRQVHTPLAPSQATSPAVRGLWIG